MKHLFATLLTVVCFATYAQFPSLPYNPDENGDGLIGVVDLQGLLANYGNEFASAVLSEDGESAIVYMGQLGYYTCEHNCEQLPGFWQVSGASDLVPVHSELNVSGYTRSWVNRTGFESNLSLNACPYYFGSNNNSQRDIASAEPYQNYRCYCAANQLPRVEYSVCGSNDNNPMSATAIQLCCQQKVAQGWMPLGGVAQASYSASQAFWRWAE